MFTKTFFNSQQRLLRRSDVTRTMEPHTLSAQASTPVPET